MIYRNQWLVHDTSKSKYFGQYLIKRCKNDGFRTIFYENITKATSKRILACTQLKIV